MAKKNMEEKKIVVLFDNDCEMAQVRLDGKVIMTGNFWDFHPDTHGIREWGEWSGFYGLARAIQITFLKKGQEAEVEQREVSCYDAAWDA